MYLEDVKGRRESTVVAFSTLYWYHYCYRTLVSAGRMISKLYAGTMCRSVWGNCSDPVQHSRRHPGSESLLNARVFKRITEPCLHALMCHLVYI